MSNAMFAMGQAAAAGTTPPWAWDLSYAYYDPPNAWDLSAAYYTSISFSVAAQETAPQGVFFKPDGTKVFITGSNTVKEYAISAPWDISSASYVRSWGTSSSPTGVFFKPDGTKMYVLRSLLQSVSEYDLSTAWSISSVSLVNSFSVAGQESSPQDLFFSPDGTKLYIVGSSGDDVNEYTLSTAWDISTASYVQNFFVNTEDTAPLGLSFKPDGTKMYVLGSVGDDINEYNLSTAWDISTASYQRVFSVAAQETNPTGIYFKPDGTGFYIIGSTGDSIYQYIIGGFSVTAQEETPEQIFFKPDGTKMYTVGSAGDTVDEYDISTAWDLSTATYLRALSVSGQDTNPSSLFFKPDGTKMYVLGQVGQDVNEYSLNTPWNISTATYQRVFSVSAQDTAPTGLFFKPDGTKMYVSGDTGNDVNEYNLSTAWDISTASYLQNFSVSGQTSGPSELFFKPDGTKMYVLGYTGVGNVIEYNLGTAWDISTATYLQGLDISSQTTARRGLFFKPDGTKLFIADIIVKDLILTYTIGIQP